MTEHEQIKKAYANYPDHILEGVVKRNRLATSKPLYTSVHEDTFHMNAVAEIAAEILEDRKSV